METDLKLTAANGSVIPYMGWVILTFTLCSGDSLVRVPFLVTTETMEYPIVGYNVIEEIMKTEHEDLSSEIQSSFVGLDSGAAQTLINFVQSTNSDYLCNVKTSELDVTVHIHIYAYILFSSLPLGAFQWPITSSVMLTFKLN